MGDQLHNGKKAPIAVYSDYMQFLPSEGEMGHDIPWVF